jgi:linoleoyl-CoA desaturase
MKFRGGTGQDFHRLLRARVAAHFEANGLDRFGGRAVAAKAVAYPAVTAALYALVVSNRLAGPPLLLAAVLFGVASLLTAFNLAHDAAHNALVPSRRVNALVYFLTFNLQGANAYLWKLRHVGSHHVSPNVEGGDADLDDNGLLRMSAGVPWRPHYRYQHLYAPLLYALFSLHWIFVYDVQFLFKRDLANLRNIRHSWAEVASLVLAKATYLGLAVAVPVARLDVPWWQVVVGFVLTHFVVSLVFVYSLIGTHFCEETAFPTADGGGYVGGS